MPKWPNEKIKPNTLVFVKLDIEVGEYYAIDHLLTSGAIKHINIIEVEWHSKKFPDAYKDRLIQIEQKLITYSFQNTIRDLNRY